MSDLPGSSEKALRDGFEAARRRYPRVVFDYDAFCAAARRRIVERLAALGLDPEPERVRSALGRLCCADLALAVSCAAGDDVAWEALAEEYTPRLVGFGRARGLDPQRAQAEATALVADLALPAPGRGADQLLVASYRGTGSLFGWLSVILLRRIARAATRRRPALIEEQGLAAVPSAQREPDSRLEDEETADTLRGALGAALAACTPRERLALVLKHRDGLRHREIAERLGVGVPRVTRLLQQGLARLGQAVRHHLPEGIAGPAYEVALASARESLSTFDAPGAPSRRGHPGGTDEA